MKPGALRPHVQAIRAALAMGYTPYALAKVYACTPHAIESIRDGLTYKEGA